MIHFDCDIDTFDETQCWNFFGIRKDDLRRMVKSLRFPAVVKFQNRSKMSGEEVFLRGLYELVNGENQYNIAENVFGRDQSQQSRAFNFFIKFIDETFYDLLSDNLEWWHDNGFIEKSRAAIQQKLEDVGLRFNDDYPQRVMGFIDCNCLEICRVAGGPRSDGPDALRYKTYSRLFVLFVVCLFWLLFNCFSVVLALRGRWRLCSILKLYFFVLIICLDGIVTSNVHSIMDGSLSTV